MAAAESGTRTPGGAEGASSPGRSQRDLAGCAVTPIGGVWDRGDGDARPDQVTLVGVFLSVTRDGLVIGVVRGLV